MHRCIADRRVARWAPLRRAALVVGAILASVGGAAGRAEAESWEWGELRASIDSFLTVSTSIRTEGQDCRLVASINGGCDNLPEGALRPQDADQGRLLNSDDGNLNWDKGDVFSVLTKGSHDIQVDWRWTGAFVRFNYFYDAILNDKDSTRRTDLRADARNRDSVVEGGTVGAGFLLLDAYAFANWEMADRLFDLRVGNQVLSWGESIFTQGGINAINGLDVNKIRLPGSELKEALAPAPIVRLIGDIWDGLSFEAYYQFEWRRTQVDPVGTFFSTSDLVGRGTDGFFLGCGDRGTSTDPGNLSQSEQIFCNYFVLKNEFPFRGSEPANDQGQWGAALRYFVEPISTEIGIYYIRLHDKYPTVSFKGTTVNDLGYFNEYLEAIDLSGISFNTEVAGIAIGGEFSFRHDQPTPITNNPNKRLPNFQALLYDVGTGGPGGVVTGASREDRIVAVLNGLYQVGPGTPFFGMLLRAIGASEVIAILELGMTHYLDYTLPRESYAAPLGVGKVDDTGMGYQMRVEIKYDRFLNTPWTVKPVVSFRHDVYGITPPGEAAYNEDAMQVGLSLEANYKERWIGLVTYSTNFEAGIRNSNRDRDFVGVSVSYAF